MKNVLLLGDSIRFGAPPNSPGYGVYVKEKLDGIANVFAPDVNGQFAQYTQRYIHIWAEQVEAEKIDIIHWNNGLWDVLRLNGDEIFTPIDIYVYFLKRIYNVLKLLFPNAKIIFALSTSVIEERAKPSFIRYNADIEAYNDAARKLMETLGVEVNDLYTVTKAFSDDMHSDWVHFNEEGSKRLAEVVTDKIIRALETH